MRILALLTVAAFATVPALALTQAAPDSAAPADTSQAKGSEDDDNRVRCRRVEVTGSLVKRGRVCRTVREWRDSSSNGNDNARKMIEESTTRSGGG